MDTLLKFLPVLLRPVHAINQAIQSFNQLLTQLSTHIAVLLEAHFSTASVGVIVLESTSITPFRLKVSGYASLLPLVSWSTTHSTENQMATIQPVFATLDSSHPSSTTVWAAHVLPTTISSAQVSILSRQMLAALRMPALDNSMENAIATMVKDIYRLEQNKIWTWSAFKHALQTPPKSTTFAFVLGDMSKGISTETWLASAKLIWWKLKLPLWLFPIVVLLAQLLSITHADALAVEQTRLTSHKIKPLLS